jgi:hypothetical protein
MEVGMVARSLLLVLLASLCQVVECHAEDRMRAREYGVEVGILATGRWNAITDVTGVAVGHVTIIEGDHIRTGVTVILPHPGNIYREKVPAGVHLGNAYGKATGLVQIEEVGQIETPIALTSTLSVEMIRVRLTGSAANPAVAELEAVAARLPNLQARTAAPARLTGAGCDVRRPGKTGGTAPPG